MRKGDLNSREEKLSNSREKSEAGVFLQLNEQSLLSSSVNGQYLKQGKYGAAVVGNHATKEVRNTSLYFHAESALV